MPADVEISDLCGRLLADEQRRRGMSDEEFAEYLEVDYTTLWRWKNGRNLGKAVRVLIPLALRRNESVLDDGIHA